MKNLLITLLLLVFSGVCAQSKYGPYYDRRASQFELLGTTSKDIIFLGNSITDGCEWNELFQNKHVKNRGIGGDITMGVHDRLEAITKGKPCKLFLMIGINDISLGVSADSVVQNISRIVKKIKTDSPRTKIYLQSILPFSDEFGTYKSLHQKDEVVKRANVLIRSVAENENVVYIDLYPHFINPATGKLKSEYSNDGLHLLGAGYMKWKEIVSPYVR